jgi:hypothetical protein
MLMGRSNVSDKKLTIREERRFVLGNRMMASEVKLGRTLFEVTSRMTNEDNSFKNIVRKVAEREIRRSDKDAG